MHRKLTTILAADAEGYSRVMEADEVGALEALRAARSVFSKFIERHEGRIANTAGEGLIAEFPSVVEAVQCALEVQAELSGRKRTPKRELRFRIGIHLGDVMVEDGDLLGEGVNLAARLQSMAEPGGILISQQVYDQVHAKLTVGFEYLGQKRPKNYAGDVAVYRVSHDSKGHATAHHTRDARPARPAQSATIVPEEQRERVVRHAKMLGAIWTGLLVIDLVTGKALWAHWPGIAFATLLGLEAAPLFVSGWITQQYVRGVVIVSALALINLVTWSGYAWVMWPAGALIVIELMRRLRPRSR